MFHAVMVAAGGANGDVNTRPFLEPGVRRRKRNGWQIAAPFRRRRPVSGDPKRAVGFTAVGEPGGPVLPRVMVRVGAA